MSELRLGDMIDDHCIKCRRLTNHAIVSIVNDEVAKVRCRSCYHDHYYQHEQAPPSKKELKKLELANAALAGDDGVENLVAMPEAAPGREAQAPVVVAAAAGPIVAGPDLKAAKVGKAVSAKAVKKTRGRARKTAG